MSYKKEVLKDKRVKFTFEVSEEDWQLAIDKAYLKTKNKFKIEGFRPGKAPKKMIENMYGKEVFYEDALDFVMSDYYEEALEKEKDSVVPVDHPDVEVKEITDKGVKFEATVVVKPEVELGQYTDLEFEKQKVKVENSEVDEEINKARNAAGRWQEVTDRACKKGDTVNINYSGSVDGVKFEGGTAENQDLELGSGNFIPGFEEQVAGMKIGEEKDIELEFPKEYHAEQLAGKKAVFAIKLNEIREKILPELNDEFAKDVSEFDTLAEYKKSIKNKILKFKEEQADIELENNIIDKIASLSKVKIPDIMIKQQIENMMQEFEYRLMYQGTSLGEYFKYTNTTKEDLEKSYEKPAKKQVLNKLVMESIIKKEKITATEKDIEKEIKKIAESNNKDYEEFRKTFKDSQIDYLKNKIVGEKLLKFVKTKNIIK